MSPGRWIRLELPAGPLAAQSLLGRGFLCAVFARFFLRAGGLVR